MDQFEQMKQRVIDTKIVRNIIIRVSIALVALALILNAVGTVGAGERGILLQFGAVQDKIFGEGLYFKIPFIQKVMKMDVFGGIFSSLCLPTPYFYYFKTPIVT